MHFKKFLTSVFSFAFILSASVCASEQSVLISGRGIGITLNSQGAMVTELAQIELLEGGEKSPAKSGGIKKGDVITRIDDTEIHSVDGLNKALEELKGDSVMIKVRRGQADIILKIKPVLDKGGKYRLGIWAKDAAAGIGTLTFYDPQTGEFGALGHGITESSTGALIKIEGGEVLSSTIVAAQKGKKGEPGELQGVFGEGDNPIGTIEKNTECGIFGTMSLSEEEMENAQSIRVGSRSDVREGKAYILANVEGNKTEKFEIEICKIPVFTGDKTKGMVIKITDKNLIKKTGGIVRGMSGCPIVQDGRLVGAVTHVFVNDPTTGYGIFIEDMMKEAES